MTRTNTVHSFSAAQQRRAVERAAELALQIKTLTSELDAIKADFKALGDGEYIGKDHKIAVVTSSVARLDQQEVKARLSPADYVQCVSVSDVTRVLIKEA